MRGEVPLLLHLKAQGAFRVRQSPSRRVYSYILMDTSNLVRQCEFFGPRLEAELDDQGAGVSSEVFFQITGMTEVGPLGLGSRCTPLRCCE